MDCDGELFEVNPELVQNVGRYTFPARQQCEEQLVRLHLAAPRRSEARRRRRERPRHRSLKACFYDQRQPGGAAEGIRHDLARTRRKRDLSSDVLGSRIYQPRDLSAGLAIADAEGSKGTGSDRVLNAEKTE
jgi:hypothetical protein